MRIPRYRNFDISDIELFVERAYPRMNAR